MREPNEDNTWAPLEPTPGQTPASLSAQPDALDGQRGVFTFDTFLLGGVIVVLFAVLVVFRSQKPGGPAAPASQPGAPPATVAQQPPLRSALNYVPWDSSFETALARAKTDNKTIMIDFYTDWCGVCKMMDSQAFVHPAVIAESQNFVNLKLNAEQYTVLADRYNIRSYPTFVFTDPDGNEIGRFSGGTDAEPFARIMQQYRRA